MALTMDTVASVKGLTVTTTQGYTLTRIGNKSLREGDTIYTDGKYVYGMEGSGGKQLPILPSVNYLFLCNDRKNPGIYGFRSSFQKPVFVCKIPPYYYRALYVGKNGCYYGNSESSSDPCREGTAYDVGGDNNQKQIFYDETYDKEKLYGINFWTTGSSYNNCFDAVVTDNNDFICIHSGHIISGFDSNAYLIVYKNGKLNKSVRLSNYYDSRLVWAHIDDDGTVQYVYNCLTPADGDNFYDKYFYVDECEGNTAREVAADYYIFDFVYGVKRSGHTSNHFKIRYGYKRDGAPIYVHVLNVPYVYLQNPNGSHTDGLLGGEATVEFMGRNFKSINNIINIVEVSNELYLILTRYEGLYLCRHGQFRQIADKNQCDGFYNGRIIKTNIKNKIKRNIALLNKGGD